MTRPPAPIEAPIRSAPVEQRQVEVCVVGGGMAGLCAAVAAARHGAQVALIQDRAVLGGNASSEVRMWICGAHGRDYKEAGLLEEIQLENLYRNQGLNYPLWDTVLYEKAAYQENLDLLLSCAVCEVEMDGDRIAALRAWHLTRQCWIVIRASQFIDCSGDSILRLSGAPVRWGTESRHDFGEPAAPEQATRQTMGNSILIQLREIDPAEHRPFVAPDWALRFDDDHPRVAGARPTGDNFWWLELGGESDTQADADEIRDELYRIAFGVWAFIKNHPDGRGHGWELEWIGALPGKRENIRYHGAHVLRQQEVEAGGRFADIVAYGGWTMDDHPPAAFHHPGPPTHHHPAPSPYGIPYRCLYGTAVPNLQFAGRNLSATHLALSSTRVMATCAMLGQAVGTAAALCVQHRCDPAQVGKRHLADLQQLLMDDDQWLPGLRRARSEATTSATLSATDGDPQALRDGIDRRLGEDWHAWTTRPGAVLELRWAQARPLSRLRLVGDSQLHRQKRMPCSYPARGHHALMPGPLLRQLLVEAEVDGSWQPVAQVTDNRRRLLQLPLDVTASALRITFQTSWDGESLRLFAVDVDAPALVAPESTDWPEPVWTGQGRA